ncbi:GNAT family N-acetyltransferase [Niveibacterium terrae]|uniref:GNAT family N-acetyltransferase n=1 Tax=Niveibacterium terrae TaxID=3373598 RepID=UPI003A912B4C
MVEFFDPELLAPELRSCRDALAAAAESAGLEATRVREQVLLDGWIVRFASSLAKRERCIIPLGEGALPLDEKFSRVETIFAKTGQPVLFRITPFAPPDLDRELSRQGYSAFEDSRVMLAGLERRGGMAKPVAGTLKETVTARGLVLELCEGGEILAGGRLKIDGGMAGLYGVHTHAEARGRGYASLIVAELLRRAETAGARHVCLQVGASNEVARHLYRKFGFIDRYAYWYRQKW